MTFIDCSHVRTVRRVHPVTVADHYSGPLYKNAANTIGAVTATTTAIAIRTGRSFAKDHTWPTEEIMECAFFGPAAKEAR